MIQLYNALSNDKEPFKPIDDETVRMYVCGQTVYDYMHIGHGRTYIAFDIIRRWLEFRGYDVETVINITDVNDKIVDRAEEENRDPWDVADEYSTINIEDFEALGVKADAFPKASDYVAEMIEAVQTLIDNGKAYEADGNVFFDVRTMEEYGKLSNQQLEDIKASREDDIVDIQSKKNPEDFVLWRARDDDDGPTWNSPWGEGVPGWHIECSVMASAILGDQFDIHGGGSDLVFPHHEDEIAQAEGVTGKEPWVRYWMHSGLVRMKDQKMSKSIGNFVPTRELLEEWRPETLRMLVAMTQYRRPLDYSEEKLEQARENVQTLEEALKTFDATAREAAVVPDKFDHNDVEVLEAAIEQRKLFGASMDDDFNTPEALSHLLELASIGNRYVNEVSNPKRPVIERIRSDVQELGHVLGVVAPSGETVDEVEQLVETLLDVRERARDEGNYDLADMIRDQLHDMGFRIDDTADGPRWSG